MITILLAKRHSLPIRIDLGRPRNLLCAVGLVAVVLATAFFSGELRALRAQEPDQRLLKFAASIEAQQVELGELRRRYHERLDALGARIGQMQAHVIRLDALGQRLTQMAELDVGEFDFNAPPARGGPAPDGSNEPALGAFEFFSELDELDWQLSDREHQLQILESMMLTRNLQAQVHPEGRPVDTGWISSFFGRRADPFTGQNAHHKGVDFAGRAGTPIRAVAAGVVSYSGARFGYGNMVELSHGNGYVTRYAHNQANVVAIGEKIEKGQVIGLMGDTGRATGSNLHFEVLSNGRAVDPLQFIEQAR